MALDAVELYNSTLVAVKPKHKCKELYKSAADAPRHPPCPTCICGDNIHDAVRCNDSTKETSIVNWYCMTYNESTGTAANVAELNHYMCEHFK